MIISIWKICVSLWYPLKLNVLIWSHKWSGSLPNIFFVIPYQVVWSVWHKIWDKLINKKVPFFMSHTDARYIFEDISPALHGTVHCTLCFTALYTEQCSSALHCTVHCTLCFTALYTEQCSSALHCTVLYTMHCALLHCTLNNAVVHWSISL